MILQIPYFPLFIDKNSVLVFPVTGDNGQNFIALLSREKGSLANTFPVHRAVNTNSGQGFPIMIHLLKEPAALRFTLVRSRHMGRFNLFPGDQ
ncbi:MULTISPECIES: hypothetical protein [unclassified Akkermansia]|jgi:hypothetical protein|uniref:hypothetical protein n=1 Tax=unclassified Akkermansia TaxID=2608915 RepID=UPI000796A9FE|nr:MULTISPECIES: hypothetical protein [unclassified Akkermansia]KXT49895.1 hypothetical protein HMPREF3038_01978 [Akkermansia sp. KLE1797]KXU54700.1 hypothetical protein HMPREF3039_01173 [Akkermansia sp. KLE1798]KZA06045.1 hypothetical protein HMPREF1326_00309 [Akkermansia sp. KLE1605]